MTRSLKSGLRSLLHRVPPWARPSLAVIAATIVAMPLVYALAVWQARNSVDEKVDSVLMTIAIEVMRRGRIGVIPLPDGGELTMGLGTTPGVVERGPETPEYFWQQAESISERSCKALAAGFLDRPDVRTLRIGSLTFDRPALPGRPPDMIGTVDRACSETDRITLSVVLEFGEQL